RQPGYRGRLIRPFRHEPPPRPAVGGTTAVRRAAGGRSPLHLRRGDVTGARQRSDIDLRVAYVTSARWRSPAARRAAGAVTRAARPWALLTLSPEEAS